MAKTARIDPARKGAAGIDVLQLQRKLNQALGKEIQHREIIMRTTPEGFAISLHEPGFFNRAEAGLQPGAGEKIKRIASVLMQFRLNMRVEGHSGNVPIHNSGFASNWELPTAPAVVVAMMLLKASAIDPRLLSVAGHGEYKPAATNDTPEGDKAKLRADIVVASTNLPRPAHPPS